MDMVMEMETDIFKEEASELLDDIEEVLLELKEKPDEKELINKLFRAFHTIKGSGDMFGFSEIAKFCHEIESVIDRIREGESKINNLLIDVLLSSRDHVAILIDEHDFDKEELEKQRDRIISELKKVNIAPAQEVRKDSELVQEKDEEKKDVVTIENRIDNVVSKPEPILRVQDIKTITSENKKITPETTNFVTKKENNKEDLQILIVEDDFVCRFLLQNLLDFRGRSHIAVDGYEAIIAVKNSINNLKPYDLICLDIMMPGMDGREVAKEIRRIESSRRIKNSKIVMTTAVDDPLMITELFNSKFCDAYLIKPILADKLEETINNLFS
jgi:chemotaxis protein histidine kinase CheA